VSAQEYVRKARAHALERRSDSPMVVVERIYAEHIGYLWDFLRHIGVPESDIEDVAHDAFLVVHRRLDSFDRSRPLRPWLSGIAVRVAAAYRRRGHRRREVMTEEIHAMDPGPGAEAELSVRRARTVLLQALEHLDAERRVIFVLHELEELSVPEIAALLEVPLNTVYSRLRRGRAQFSAVVRRLQARGGR